MELRGSGLELQKENIILREKVRKGVRAERVSFVNMIFVAYA